MMLEAQLMLELRGSGECSVRFLGLLCRRLWEVHARGVVRNDLRADNITVFGAVHRPVLHVIDLAWACHVGRARRGLHPALAGGAPMAAWAALRPRGPELPPLPPRDGIGHRGAAAGTAAVPAPGGFPPAVVRYSAAGHSLPHCLGGTGCSSLDSRVPVPHALAAPRALVQGAARL
ncbi:hypothetical protein E2C01_016513 [Portunus trituberculatus]|uniref:Protein kinase domain-containing protein n=1 Tax=Portunus trituberculatus TaxID=210409 RepID=A0A5B7DQY5_PORTR|nr:hypothetical protein [Portunus trituberculatus]